MGFEDWQKENTAMGFSGGFGAWQQENKQLGIKLSGFDAWKQENEQLGIVPETGFVGGFTERPEKFVPVIGSLVGAERTMSTVSAAKRLEADAYGGLTPEQVGWGMVESPEKYQTARQFGAWTTSPYLAGTEAYEQMKWTPERQREHDLDLVSDWLVEASKQYTTGGRIGQIVGEMPAFMTEFMMTGGVGAAPKAFTKQVIERAIGKGAKREVLAKMGAWAIGSTVQATLGMSHRTFQTFASRRLPKDIYADEFGNLEFEWSKENPFTSFAKAWGDTVIEVASEQSGPAISKAGGWMLNKLPFGKQFVGKLHKAYQKLHPNISFGNFINKISTKAGYHGILEEIGEEYIGDAMRAVANVDDFGAGPDAGVGERLKAALNQDIKNTPAMLAAFAVPGVGRAAIGAVAAPPSRTRLEKQARIIQESDLTDFQKAAALEKIKEQLPIEEQLKEAGIEVEKPAEAQLPTKIYHATTRVFEGLPTEQTDMYVKRFHTEPSGVFYSVTPEQAKQATGAGENQRIIEAEVSAKNPFIITNENVDAYEQMYIGVIQQIQKEYGDTSLHWEDFLSTYPTIEIEVSKRFANQLRSLGYDAVYNTRNQDFIALKKSAVKPAEVAPAEGKPTEAPGIVQQEQKPDSPFQVSESAKRRIGIARKLASVLTELEAKRPELRKRTEEAREKELQTFNEIYESLKEEDPIIASRMARSQVKGFLREEVPELQEQISRDEITDLMQAIREAKIPTGQRLNLDHFFEDILARRQPFRSHIKAFDRFFGTEILKRVPKPEAKGFKKAWNILFEVLNVPKAIVCSTDFSAGGIQALMVAPSHPIIWSKAVAKGYRAFFSQDYLDLMELEMRTHPFYHLIEEHGRGLITEVGDKMHGEEYFVSELAHRIPLIGSMVKASDRAFVGTLNNIRSNLFYQWMEMNPNASNIQIKEILDHIGNLTGRGRGKAGGKFEKLAPELGAVLWAPRLYLGTIKSMTDVVTKSHIRKQVAGDLVRATGFLLGILALFSLMPDTEVELDPRSTDFGKIKHGNTRLSFFGRHTQMIRFVAQMLSGKKKSTGTGRVHSRPRLDIAARYLRSKLNPMAGITWDMATGRTFLGERMEYKDPNFVAKYFMEHTVPMFVQDVADGIRYQGLGTTLWTSPLGLHGIGMQTYEIHAGGESQRLKDHYARTRFGVDWDQLGPDAQTALRENQPLIERYEERARAERERYVYEDWTQAEQRLAGQRVLKGLKKSIRSEFERLEMPIGGLSRRLSSSWMLNDKRYKDYEKETTQLINRVAPRIVESAAWKNMGPDLQRHILDQIVDECKTAVRQQIVSKARFEDVQRVLQR